jgi:hypothetical protein
MVPHIRGINGYGHLYTRHGDPARTKDSPSVDSCPGDLGDNRRCRDAGGARLYEFRFPAAQSAPQSAPSMTAAEKEHALIEFMRRDAPGEKIDPALLKAFIEAQNQGATSGIAIGQTAPAFELKDQNGRTHTLKSLMGRKGALLVFTRSADW